MGMKQLQISACGRSRSSDQQSKWCCLSRCPTLSSHQSASFYLNELLFGVKLRHQHVLPVRHSGERHTQPPRGQEVGVGGQVAVQARLQHFDQVEGGVQGAQVPLAGLLCHLNDVLAAFCWKTQKPGEQNRKWALRSLEPPCLLTGPTDRRISLGFSRCVGSILGTDSRSRWPVVTFVRGNVGNPLHHVGRWSTAKTVRGGSPTWCPRHCSLTVCSYECWVTDWNSGSLGGWLHRLQLALACFFSTSSCSTSWTQLFSQVNRRCWAYYQWTALSAGCLPDHIWPLNQIWSGLRDTKDVKRTTWEVRVQ